MQSPKRPHTPHSDRKETPPRDIPKLEDDHVDRPPKQEKEEHITKTPPLEAQLSPINDENNPMDIEEFEPILSDEDILDDPDHFQDIDYEFSAYTNNDDIIKQFVPGSTEIRKYESSCLFKIIRTSDETQNIKSTNISNSHQKCDRKIGQIQSEQICLIDLNESLKSIIGVAEDFFKSSITKYVLPNFEHLNAGIKEEFIHLCEKIIGTFVDQENLCAIAEIYDQIVNGKAECDPEISNQLKYIVHTLIDWSKIALNYEMANAQEQPGYKIRHIKIGVRLAEWFCSSIHFIKLLWNEKFEIQQVLLDLYNKEYMALSIKLLILKALDVYLLHKDTTERFLKLDNGYKTLMELLKRNPLVRLKFAINSILKKLNLYELLHKLNFTILKMRNAEDESSADEINFIVKALDQILHVMQDSPFFLAQPKRFLPVASQFEINRNDTTFVLTKYFNNHSLLEGLTLLLAHPTTMNIPAIKITIYEILSELLQTSVGLEYLSNKCSVIEVLLKFLLQDEEILDDEAKSHSLGLNIAYKLQCLYHIEALLHLGKVHNYDPDQNDVFDHLHGMYCLTFTNIGKLCCVQVLGMSNYIRCLLQFLDSLQVKESKDIKIKKSPEIGYIIDLIAMVLIIQPNIPLMDTHYKQLLNVISSQDLFEPCVSVKIQEFAPFVKLYETIYPYNYDNITPIVDVITRNLENVTSFPGNLVIALNILHELGISKHSNKSAVLSENPLNNYTELKYKHVVLQLYSLDGVATLTKILTRICEYYEQPSLHSSVFVSSFGINIINTIQPAVELLKQMLTYVIHCRNTDFKDLTSVPVLLQTYNLLRAFPSNSLLYCKAQKVCIDLIDTLLVYTQPLSEEVHEKDSLNKTLWTRMCGEVIKYASMAPYTFMSGLLIFSELLPLPLPLHTREQLTKEEISWAVNLRKLWSAHLHSHSSSLQVNFQFIILLI